MKLFSENMPFFKGNLHMHTTVSDGRYTPEEAMKLYKDNGYDFVALTDHWKVGERREYEGMLVLPGVEYDWGLDTQLLHVVALLPDAACASDIRRGMPYAEVVEKINAAGGVCVAAHPAWSLNTTEFLMGLDGISVAEVYNTLSGEPHNGPRANASSLLDVAACNGKYFNLIATDDSHFYNGEPCRSFICLQASELSVPAVLDALKKGRFYASQGPQFKNIELADDQLIIETSPVKYCTVCSNLVWVDDRCHSGRDITRTVYKVRYAERFVRVELTDEHGRKAWSSPIVL